MDKKLNVKRHNDYNKDSSSDMEEEDEDLDMTKIKRDLENEEQINPQEYYKEDKKNSQKNQVELEEEDEKQEDFDMVNVDFNFLDPNEKQFHSIKVLVNGYLDGLSFASSELSDVIIKQVQVGTMVGIDDPEEKDEQNVLGFTTTIPLKLHENEKVFQEIGQYVNEKSQKHNDQHDIFMGILQSQRIGLLINERILNCSPFIVPTLHQQFYQDYQWVQEEEPQEGEKYKFDYLLVMSKVYKNLKMNKGQQKKQKNNQLQEYIYQKFEDYKFLEKSENFFMFEAQNTKSGGDVTNHNQDVKDQICYRVIYLLKWEEYVNAIPLLPQELIPMYQGQNQNN